MTREVFLIYIGISRRTDYELFQTHAEHGGIQNFAIGASKMD